jgi:hypothetical protein
VALSMVRLFQPNRNSHRTSYSYGPQAVCARAIAQLSVRIIPPAIGHAGGGLAADVNAPSWVVVINFSLTALAKAT